ncbi:hypothetical protein GCM10010431_54870 [Streptomyces kunmingensis]
MAIRRVLPRATQIGDRWHLWHNLCKAVPSKVKAHSTCWATLLDAPIYDGPRAQTTLEPRHHVHGLLDQGVGLRLFSRNPAQGPSDPVGQRSPTGSGKAGCCVLRW